MRPRGFVALPGDAFGGEDEAPRRGLSDLLAQEPLWIGMCAVMALAMLAWGGDQATRGEWGAAAISWSLVVLNGAATWLRWHSWSRSRS